MNKIEAEAKYEKLAMDLHATMKSKHSSVATKRAIIAGLRYQIDACLAIILDIAQDEEELANA